eukprot:COSAG01_NODE_35341_length_533_cov_1.027650_1_plen_40_part_01
MPPIDGAAMDGGAREGLAGEGLVGALRLGTEGEPPPPPGE